MELSEVIESVEEVLESGSSFFMEEKEAILHYLKELKELKEVYSNVKHEEAFIDYEETERDILESEYFHPND